MGSFGAGELTSPPFAAEPESAGDVSLGFGSFMWLIRNSPLFMDNFQIDSWHAQRGAKSMRFALGMRRVMISRARFTHDWQWSSTIPSEVAM